MFQRVRRSPLVAGIAALSLVVAACGDDSDDTDDGGTTETDAGSEDTAAEDEATDATDEGAAAEDGDEGGGGEAAAAEGGDVDRSDWPDTLVMGAVPSEESSTLQQEYEALIQVLEEDLDITVDFFEATEYAGIIEAQIAGDVHLAQYGPFSYVIATANGAEIEPIGALVDGPDEEPGYQSYGITQGDNDEINSLADFEGKNVCFVDPASTSGFLYPSAGLLEAGIDPEADVNPTFAGGHDASAISVANGDCEAGFAFDTMVTQQLVENGDIEEGDLKVVWESEIIAGSPTAVSNDLPESLRSEIRRLLLDEVNVDTLVERGVCDSVDTCTVGEEDRWGYAEVDDSFYDGVRAVCDTTKAEACQG